jgi:hypothetical protein
MSNTLWTETTNDKLYLQSGQFTSTIKDSLSAAGLNPEGISVDAFGDVPYCNNSKLYKQSGQFSSTVKTSLSLSYTDTHRGITVDDNDTILIGSDNFSASKIRRNSGQFSSTVKDSASVYGIDTYAEGISLTNWNAIPWVGRLADKLYLQRGIFTQVITSQAVNTVDTDPRDISWDGTNTTWIGSQADKLYLTSGQFTSTLKDSEDISGTSTTPTGVEDDSYTARTVLTPLSTDDWIEVDNYYDKLWEMSGTFTSTLKQSISVTSIATGPRGISNISTAAGNTAVGDDGTNKLFMFSGRFTTTIKDSESISGVDTYIEGISTNATDTYWVGDQADKLYCTSGQFTSTLKTSQSVTSVETGPTDISITDTNTLWCGDNGDKLYLTSGKFTSTLKDSESWTNPSGISTDGTNTYVLDLFDKVALVSGQFSSTIKQSYIMVDIVANGPSGIESLNFGGRVGEPEIFERSLSTGITFEQVLSKAGSIATKSASTNITFGQTVEKPVEESPHNDITFGQIVATTLIHNLVTDITFGQAVVVAGDYSPSLENDITFGQEVGVSGDFGAAVETNIEFAQAVNPHVIAISVSNDITFEQEVSLAGSTYNISLETDIEFEQLPSRTYTPTATTTITFDQYPSWPASTDIEFTQTAVGVIGHDAENDYTFSQTVSLAGSIYNLSLSNNIAFSQQVIGRITTSEHEYDPQQAGTGLEELPSVTLTAGNTFVLYDGVTTLTLRNPEFGNEEQMQVKRVNNRLRSGTLKVSRESFWPRNRIQHVGFIEIERADALTYLDFVETNLGKEITITDHEGRVWDAIILNPKAIIKSLGRDTQAHTRYALEIEYMGTLQ